MDQERPRALRRNSAWGRGLWGWGWPGACPQTATLGEPGALPARAAFALALTPPRLRARWPLAAASARPSPEGGLGVMQAAPCAWLYVFAVAGPAVRVAFDGHGGLLFLPFLRPGSCELHPVLGEQASACWRELGSICRPLGEALNFKAPHRAPQTGSCGRQSGGRNRPSSLATLSTWR